jgi:hypothetical protein
MLASDAAPLFTLHARPSAFHPISRRRLSREPILLSREEEAQRPWWWTVVKDRRGKQVQKMKEMGAKGRRMGVWIRTHDSSLVRGSPLGAALHAHTMRSTYPGADQWV